MAVPSESELLGEWVHSHEEDGPGQKVFRPASYAFPPARGRTSVELRSDGSYIERSPGPVDVPEESTGSWTLDGGRLTLSGDGRHEVWHLTDATPDRLLVAK